MHTTSEESGFLDAGTPETTQIFVVKAHGTKK
jgi:hypothetical protein